MKMVSKKFIFKEEEISLSFPPVSIGNTCELRSFIAKIRAFDGICRLCVKVFVLFQLNYSGKFSCLCTKPSKTT